MSATANRTDTTYTFGVITPEELDRLSEATSQGSFQQWSGQVRLAKIRGHEAECVGVCDASGNRGNRLRDSCTSMVVSVQMAPYISAPSALAMIRLCCGP